MRSAFVIVLVCVIAAGCSTAPVKKTFEVTVQVDYGPAGRPAMERMVSVGASATAETALAQAVPVSKGAVCCDAREVAGIDGVMTDPATNRWWTVSINGSKKVSPYKTRLKPGDVVRWEYRQYAQ